MFYYAPLCFIVVLIATACGFGGPAVRMLTGRLSVPDRNATEAKFSYCETLKTRRQVGFLFSGIGDVDHFPYRAENNFPSSLESVYLGDAVDSSNGCPGGSFPRVRPANPFGMTPSVTVFGRSCISGENLFYIMERK